MLYYTLFFISFYDTQCTANILKGLFLTAVIIIVMIVIVIMMIIKELLYGRN